jgi:hypothetical protein
MTTHQDLLSGLDKIADEGLNELLRRVQDINNSYRAVAEKMGQLYMCADELQLTALTRDLDKPMRNASDNEQLFSAILEDLQSFTRRTS